MSRGNLLTIAVVLILLGGLGFTAWFLFASNDMNLGFQLDPSSKADPVKPALDAFEDEAQPAVTDTEPAAKDETPAKPVKIEKLEPKIEKVDEERVELPTAVDGFVAPNAVVWGQVRTERGVPLEGARVSLLVKRGSKWAEAASVSTESTGIFGFGEESLLKSLPSFATFGGYYSTSPLQPGDVRLEARHRGYKLWAEEFQAVGILQKSLELEVQQSVVVNFHVINDDGVPLGWFLLSVLAKDGGFGERDISRFDTPDEQRFQLMGERRRRQEESMRSSETRIPTLQPREIEGSPGWYTANLPGLADVRVTLLQSGFRCVDPDGGELILDLSNGQSRTIEVHFRKFIEGETRDFTPGESTIRGVVKVAHSREQVGKISIDAISEDGVSRRINAEEDGSYQINGLPDGRYLVRVWTRGVSKGSLEREIELRGQAIVDFNVASTQLKFDVVAKGVDLTSVMISLGSRRASATPIHVFSSAESEGTVIPRNAREGEFEFECNPGAYTLHLSDASATFVGADSDGVLRFNLPETGGKLTKKVEVIPAISIDAQVIDREGYGWAGAEARLVPQSRINEIRRASTGGEKIDWTGCSLIAADQLGRLRAKQVPPGDYVLLVWTSSRDANRWDSEERVSAQESVNLGAIRVDSPQAD